MHAAVAVGTLFCSLFCSLFAPIAVARAGVTTDLYVAANGSDTGPGTLERPLATPEAARDSIRRLKAEGPLPPGGVTVWLRGGVYLREKTFSLKEIDSGTVEAPVVYRAHPGETVSLIGGKRLPAQAFSPVTDPATAARLDPLARSRVLCLDLTKAGINHRGPFPNRFTGGGGLFGLFFEGRRMPISRWPNEGAYSAVREVLDSGLAPQPHGGIFAYRGDRPGRWKTSLAEGGVWVSGFWRVPWVIESVRVAEIDTKNGHIRHAVPVPLGIGSKYTTEVNGTRRGDGKEPWYALNLLEEIDQAGEWAVDFRRGLLYFWPPSDLANSGLWIADSDEPVIDVSETSYLTLQDLTFEGGLSDCVSISGGSNTLLAGCTIRNTGGVGARISGGSRIGIVGCDFYGIGAEAIEMEGGDRATLIPAGNQIINCHIRDIGQMLRTAYAVVLQGVGNRAAHNLIHDAPLGGIRYQGNDHVLEYNEIHNIGLDGGDLGAFYTTNDWASRGGVVRYNLVHHAPNANAVYLDDGRSGETVTGNIAYKVACGPFLGGGHDNVIRGNLTIASGVGLHVDDRGVPRGYTIDSQGPNMKTLRQIPYTEEPWKSHYPGLVQMMTRPDRLPYPTGNRIEGNGFFGCTVTTRLSGTPSHFEFMTVGKNQEGNEDDAGFADLEKLDFRVRARSGPAARLSDLFYIPVEHIGLRIDEYRRSLPSLAVTRRFEDRVPRRVFDSDTDREATDRIVRPAAKKP